MTGGAGTGGESNGGASTGGAANGGESTGGAATGGESTGGAQGTDCPMALVGFAAVDADGVRTTTGGGDATPVEVTTFAELEAAARGDDPRVIVVSGTIRTTDGGGYAMPVGSNKTLVGADENATIYGGVVLSDVSNVILRNLNVQGVWPDAGPDDAIASRGSHHVWYDHLNVWDAGDGLLDITNESSYQTVSWCKFWYTDASHDHRLASLNGSGGGDHPEDWGKLKVTYHHNWWAELVDQRMPRVMYGQGHAFNNYFNSPGNGYCIGVGSYGSVLIENNYFEDVNNPHQFMYDVFMYAAASGNEYDLHLGRPGHGARGDPGRGRAGVVRAGPLRSTVRLRPGSRRGRARARPALRRAEVGATTAARMLYPRPPCGSRCASRSPWRRTRRPCSISWRARPGS